MGKFGGEAMELDEYQRIASRTEESRVLVVAPPGSGKTTVLLERLGLTMDSGVAPGRILVLTFSKAAAEELKARFGGDRKPFFGTLHGFSYRMLRSLGIDVSLVYGKPEQEVKLLMQRSLNLAREDIDNLMRDFSAYRMALFKGAESRKEAMALRDDVFRKAMDLYEGFKKERNLMDFDDLQTRFLSLLEDQELTYKIRRTFTHILVDEFQDLDPVQLQILVKLSEGGSIFCVGDEDQCIYAFRGSDPSAMMDFEDRFGGRKLYLKYNYRSSRTIVDYAGEVIRFNRARNDKELLPDRKDLTRIRKVFPPSQEGMLSDISTEVMKDIYGSYAVLYRTNEEGERIREHLRREKIPFRCRDGYSFYRTMVARDILEYMKYAATGDPRHFARVANKPYRYIPKDDLRRMASGEDVKTVLLSGEKGDFAKGRMKELIRDLKPMSRKSPRDLVRYIGKVLGYEDYLKDYSERTGRDIDELNGDLDEMLELAGNHRMLAAFLEESMKEPESDPSAKLLLSTIHGVKGLEFDKVFLVNCVEGIMPQAVTGADLEEERRIFYVGITRARHELDIYSPRTIHGKERKRSRFVI